MAVARSEVPLVRRRLANAAIVVEVLPGIGGKISSILDARTGHEYLSQPDARGHHAPAYGSPFEASDLSGWDECFPAIGEGWHPTKPWAQVQIPDHGELWTIPWTREATEGRIDVAVDGIRFPYRFRRSLEITPDGFRCHYSVTNLSSDPFPCFWSSHPLFRATPETHILIPTDKVRLQASLTGRLGALLDAHPWPTTTDRKGRSVALDEIGPADSGEAEKVYSDPLVAGWAALHDRASDQWLLFAFDPTEIPFVGYWANRRAWPSGSAAFHLALEPCTGRPDRLDVALERREAWVLEPNSTKTWELGVRIGVGAADLRRAITDTLPPRPPS
jgi:galactose mutarotase-like enzyme